MRISICLCTCNGQAHLDEQLRSIAAQSRQPDEMVVADDCSQDTTLDILRRFAAEASYPVHIHVNEQRLGPAANFSQAFARCRGDVICPCDQDDIWHQEKLRRIEKAMTTHARALLAFGDMRIIDQAGQPTGLTQWQALGFQGRTLNAARRGGLFDVLLRYNVVSGTAMAFRASLRDLALPVPQAWMHDEWLAFMAAACGDVLLIDEPLVDYRQHQAQQIGSAVYGLVNQWRYAREKMDREYFETMLQRTQVACDRLQQQASRLRSRDRLTAMQQKLMHCQHRLRMREAGRFRISSVMREWRMGHYHRFGHGWKSFIQDIFLR